MTKVKKFVASKKRPLLRRADVWIASIGVICFWGLVAIGDGQNESTTTADTEVEDVQPAEKSRRSESSTAKVDAISATEAFNAYRERVRSLDPDGAILASVELWEFDKDQKTIQIEVSTGWHYQPVAAREDAATSLWSLWAQHRSPNDPSKAYMRLVSASGREVGGYGPLKGIYIKE